jgi:leucyl aminopeptidase
VWVLAGSAGWLSAIAWPTGSSAFEPDPLVPDVIERITADSLLAQVEKLVSFGVRRWNQPGGKAAQEYIEDFFAGLGVDEVYAQDFDSGSDNVVAVLRGALRPDVHHVLGAHYDSLGPGADDNASGTSAVLEAARAFAESGHRPAETIIFVAFAAEEDGMKGSQAFVQIIKAEGKTVADMVALDVIGYLKPGTATDLSVKTTATALEGGALIATLGEVAAAYLPGRPFEAGPGCA